MCEISLIFSVPIAVCYFWFYCKLRYERTKVIEKALKSKMGYAQHLQSTLFQGFSTLFQLQLNNLYTFCIVNVIIIEICIFYTMVH